MTKIRTTYSPGVGIAYIITNKITGEKKNVSTLSSRDIDQKPWRSPRGTIPGNEFFKAKSGKKKIGFTYFKFMNSNQHPECLSDDGIWLFDGVKLDGTILPKLSEIVRKEKIIIPEISNKSIRATVEKIDVSIDMTNADIKEKIESISVDDFSADDQLIELLSENSVL